MTLRMRLTDLERNDRRRIKHEPFASEQERRQAMRELDRRIARLRQAEQQHPCRQCPDLQRHLTWGHRWARETRELERVRHRYESRTGSVARQFDRICGVLDTLGYLERAERNGRTDYRLTQAGQLLRHLYSELDLTVAQALREGVFDGLNPSQMAAVASALVYEARRGNGGEPRHYPGGHRGAVAQAAERLLAIAAQVSDLCEDAALEEPRQLDFGLTDVVYEWAEGEGLYRVLYGTELTGGDFVRNAKRGWPICCSRSPWPSRIWGRTAPMWHGPHDWPWSRSIAVSWRIRGLTDDPGEYLGITDTSELFCSVKETNKEAWQHGGTQSARYEHRREIPGIRRERRFRGAKRRGVHLSEGASHDSAVCGGGRGPGRVGVPLRRRGPS